jgi:hypothetical protein
LPKFKPRQSWRRFEWWWQSSQWFPANNSYHIKAVQ